MASRTASSDILRVCQKRNLSSADTRVSGGYSPKLVNLGFETVWKRAVVVVVVVGRRRVEGGSGSVS